MAKALKYSCPSVWNSLLPSNRAISSLSKLKSCIKSHLFNKAYEKI